jgi:hypothetical protein
MGFSSQQLRQHDSAPAHSGRYGEPQHQGSTRRLHIRAKEPRLASRALRSRPGWPHAARVQSCNFPIQAYSHSGFQLIRLQRWFIRVDDGFQQRRPGGAQGLSDRAFHLARMSAAEAIRAASSCERHEIDGRQITPIFSISQIALLEG